MWNCLHSQILLMNPFDEFLYLQAKIYWLISSLLFLGKCNNFLTTCQCFGFWLQASRGPCKSCLFYCPVINWNHSGSTLVIFYLDGWSKWRRSLWYRKLYIGDIHHFWMLREGGTDQPLPLFKNSIRNYVGCEIILISKSFETL